MRAGDLKHEVTLERMSKKGGDFGDGVTKWEPVLAGIPAAVTPLRGRERLAADQVQSQVTHRISMRWMEEVADMTARDRLTMGTRVFNITSVINVGERNVELELMCVEVV